MNSTEFIGHLGGDVDLRYLPDGKAVGTFSVAVNDGYGDNKKTLWYRVTVWERRAETCNQYIGKGSKVFVRGRLQAGGDGGPRVFQRKDGTYAASFELTADMVEFLDPKGQREMFSEETGGEFDYDDDVPF